MSDDRNTKTGPSHDSKMRLEWDTDQIFARSNNEGDVAIKVNRADSQDGRRFYSYELGRVGREGGFTRFLSPAVSKGINWRAELRFIDLETYAPLMADVEAHIRDGIQVGFDAALDRRRQEEEQAVARGKPKMKPGLKKIGKRTAP
jgi:hypothetical protein